MQRPIPTELADWRRNCRSRLKKSRLQKPYGVQFFETSRRAAAVGERMERTRADVLSVLPIRSTRAYAAPTVVLVNPRNPRNPRMIFFVAVK
jgi:hypothetical protein